MNGNSYFYSRLVPRNGFHVLLGSEIHPATDVGPMKLRGRLHPQWALIENTGSGAPAGRRVIQPLIENPALYREFASLRWEDTEAVCKFASSYGSLGFEEDLPCRPPAEEGRLIERRCEIDWHWWFHTNMIRVAVKVWDLLRAQDLASISKLFRWIPEPENPDFGDWVFSSFGHVPPTSTDSRERCDFGSGRIRLSSPTGPGEDVMHIACVWLRRLVNSNLVGGGHMNAGTSAGGGVSVQFVFDEQSGADVLRNVPRDLLSALWLQFAQAIERDTDYRECEVCGKCFVVTAKSDRYKPRKFCSDACTMQNYRSRRDRAIALRGEKLSDAQIAKRLKAEGLETDVKTIQKWTKKKG